MDVEEDGTFSVPVDSTQWIDALVIVPADEDSEPTSGVISNLEVDGCYKTTGK